MKFSRKETVKISIIYSLILIFANILGILISSTIESPGGHLPHKLRFCYAFSLCVNY
ncbi:hypothetical protein [uncultured Treponema sp.]|uniref:hypothetical protein n=1 Tax=uncultured Treponema sp. TaxID=162155 RepID=UPI002598A1F9|nr:hypothetical protein [uncultured Treponema sp.]